MFFLLFKLLLLKAIYDISVEFLFYAYGLFINKKMWKKLEDKWIVVTGSNDGIGKALVLSLAKRKQKLILVGRKAEALEEVKNEVLKHTEECKIVLLDYLNLPDLKDVFSNEDNIGMLINNAGMMTSDKTKSDAFDSDIVKVNVISTVLVTKRISETMVAKKFGIILNIGSVLSEVASPVIGTYASTKAFIKHWSISLHYELKNNNIHVEAILPGLVCTKMSGVKNASLFSPAPEDFAESVLKVFGGNSWIIPWIPHLAQCLAVRYIPGFLVAKGVRWRLRKNLEEEVTKGK